MDEVWVVTVPRELQVARIMNRDKLTREEAEGRIAAQLPPEEKAARAAVVIENTGSLAELTATVKKLWEERIKTQYRQGVTFRIFRTGKHKMILGICGLSIRPEILGAKMFCLLLSRRLARRTLMILLLLALFLPTKIWGAFFPFPYREIIEEKAGNTGVDPRLVAALIYVESKFNHLAVSRKGAAGLMQLLPETGEWVARQQGMDFPGIISLNRGKIWNWASGTWPISTRSLRARPFWRWPPITPAGPRSSNGWIPAGGRGVMAICTISLSGDPAVRDKGSSYLLLLPASLPARFPQELAGLPINRD